MTWFTRNDPQRSPALAAVFIAFWIERPSYSDPTLRPFADRLRLTDTWGKGLADRPPRRWNLDDVFDKPVREATPFSLAWNQRRGLGDSVPGLKDRAPPWRNLTPNPHDDVRCSALGLLEMMHLPKSGPLHGQAQQPGSPDIRRPANHRQ